MRLEDIVVATPPIDDVDTGFVVAIVEDGGERTFLTSVGAEATLSTGQLDELDVSESDLVYFSGYALLHESNARALLKFLTQIPGATNFLFDPGPIVNEISESMLDAVFERVDWFSCNQREAFLLTDASNSSESARLLRARMNRGGAIVRVGAEGCVVAQSERHSIAVAGFAVESVDTNGAGTVIWERSRPRWPRVARLWVRLAGPTRPRRCQLRNAVRPPVRRGKNSKSSWIRRRPSRARRSRAAPGAGRRSPMRGD